MRAVGSGLHCLQLCSAGWVIITARVQAACDRALCGDLPAASLTVAHLPAACPEPAATAPTSFFPDLSRFKSVLFTAKSKGGLPAAA